MGNYIILEKVDIPVVQIGFQSPDFDSITIDSKRFKLSEYPFKTRELEYINAGHNQPILYNMADKSLIFLDKGCVGIGMLDEIPLIRKGNVMIEEPSKLLCYTDGLIELMDGRGVSTETAEIESCLSNKDSIEDNIENIIKRQKVLEDSTAIFDDISILGIELF